MTEYERTAVKNVITLGCSRQLKAKNISIYIKDGQPYIHWIGEFSNGNDVYEVDIPKMDVNIDVIIEDKPIEFDTLGNVSYPKISFARQFYAVQDNVEFNIACKKREMTKEQIEKELGYKVKIKDENDEEEYINENNTR